MDLPTEHATSGEAHHRLILTKALDLSAKKSSRFPCHSIQKKGLKSPGQRGYRHGKNILRRGVNCGFSSPSESDMMPTRQTPKSTCLQERCITGMDLNSIGTRDRFCTRITAKALEEMKPGRPVRGEAKGLSSRFQSPRVTEEP